VSWLIVRVFAGHPFEVEMTLRGLGLEAYCPRYTTKRRHPFVRRLTLDVVRPLFPGYMFVRQAFDARGLNTSRFRVRLMAKDGRYLLASESEIGRVREAEQIASAMEAQPMIGDRVGEVSDFVSAVVPKKFTKLGDVQARKKVAA
jgi:hypothetical protein